ncbi:MAG: methylmalonyl Co-A mutase-associated GTPase MeaB [Myxococcales bacterium]|nr:methylmalonyl Co-A mutase-associated GTPase MeaB [Myxococcales bacterium]MCB9521104.1 methylmalonyl Co-A mutase-associated GTPase MeaB [Myxococcales bacterium]
MTTPSLDELVAGVRSGDRAMIGRAITLVESRRPDHEALAQQLLVTLLPHSGGAHRVGISGVPGVGKSTFIEALGCRLVDAGRRVAVLAVDPSSARTRGSILGDKTRMNRLAASSSAFIRPSPTSGTLGGVARRTREALLVCEAAGYDVVLVETVGVGQSETEVAAMTDFFLVLMLAGAGDELQGIKRGILELADALAVTKADGDNVAAARRAKQRYEHALHAMSPTSPNWRPRVLTCSAVTGDGLDEVWGAVTDHRAALAATGELAARRREQARGWLWAIVDDAVRRAVHERAAESGRVAALEEGVMSGDTTPALAAAELLEALGLSSARQ